MISLTPQRVKKSAHARKRLQTLLCALSFWCALLDTFLAFPYHEQARGTYSMKFYSNSVRRSFRVKTGDALWIAPATVFIIMLSISAFTGFWPWTQNPYPSYALQAQSWLQGRLDLGQDYPWLELAIYKGKYYVSFPPFPSYVLLPFAVFCGANTPDSLIAWVVTLMGVTTSVSLCRQLGATPRSSIFWTLYLYLGTGYLFLGQTSWVWFFAQSMAFTLSLLSLKAALDNRGGWSLSFWACAVGCRPLNVLYLPLLFYLLRQNEKQLPIPRWIFQHLLWAVGPCIIGGSYMLLNTLRFDNPLEFGHNYLPEFVRAAQGQFSLSYVPDHLKLLLRLPGIDPESGMLIFEHLETNAFFLICPFSISFLIAWGYGMIHRTSGDLPLLLGLPLLAVCHVLLICMHRTLGGFQFGNRYFVDLMPFLLLGLLSWKNPNARFDAFQTPLFALGTCLNLLGTVMTYRTWGS